MFVDKVLSIHRSGSERLGKKKIFAEGGCFKVGAGQAELLTDLNHNIQETSF